MKLKRHHFKEQILYGILIGAFASIINAIYQYIFNRFIDPYYLKETMDKIAIMTEHYLIKHNIPQEVIDKQMEELQSVEIPSPLKGALFSIPSNIIFFTIISLLTSFFVRKENKSISDGDEEIAV